MTFPGRPREYFGPLKTDPAELFVHTTEDLQNLDHFLEFLVGNGQLLGRFDALGSQHVQGRKQRSAIGVYHSDAWGAEGFQHYRCRPTCRILNNLECGVASEALLPSHLSSYRQSVDFDRGVLETSFDWDVVDCRGHTEISVFASQVDPDVLVFRFCDRVDGGQVKRRAVLETVVPYMHRFVEEFGREDWVTPKDSSSHGSNSLDAHWLDYEMRSGDLATRFCIYGRPIFHGGGSIDLGRAARGGMAASWDCPAGSTTSVDLVYSFASSRSQGDPERRAAMTVEGITTRGVDDYEKEHSRLWNALWSASTLKLADGFWQKQIEIARYTLLINSGGSFPGNIAADEFAWDAHMLDTPLALNGLLDWGHVDIVERTYRAIDGLYRGAVENAELVSDYIEQPLVGESALLPTFLTHDGRVALYDINHFMLHSQQNAAHALGLLRIADFGGRERSHVELAYRWLRAYANYALLITEWNDELGGYVFPLWKSGTLDEREWWPLLRESLPEKLESIADLFPETLTSKELFASSDVSLAHRWVLSHASQLSVELGVDEELRQKWMEVASKVVVVSNDEVILRHEKDDGETRCMIAPEAWGLFYPCEDSHLDFPADKVKRTLDSVTLRRNPHIPSWNGIIYSIAHAILGDGERAWQCLQAFLLLQDPRCIQAQDNVGWEGFVYYYFLNYGFFLTSVRKMLLQSQRDEIILFPALPRALEGGVEFTGLPVGVGLRVSASLVGDEGEATIYRLDGSVALKVSGKIRGRRIRLSEIDGSSPTGSDL